jgi:GTP-dependent phosphoenolpyruvate carboxykinase
MINIFNTKIIYFLIILILGLQIFIYFHNQNSLTKSFSQKNITVENFSSVVLSNSGITKIGSEKLNKIDDNKIYLEGESYLENKEYKIYGNNISINLIDEISSSEDSVKVINSMGTLKAKGFKNIDYDGKIIFFGEVEFVINN